MKTFTILTAIFLIFSFIGIAFICSELFKEIEDEIPWDGTGRGE